MTLNDQITQKAKQTRQQAETFESSLATQFKDLKTKSKENVNLIEKQVNILEEVNEIENNIANEVASISTLFSKNGLLENLVYAKIQKKLSAFPKADEEVEIKLPTKPKQKKDKPKKDKKPGFSIPFLSPKKAGDTQKPPQKLASGGITPGSSQVKQKVKQNLAVPYADTLKTTLQASGIFAVNVLGEFISATGGLGGFFAPYLNSIVKPFALALGVNQSIINSLLGQPVAAATLNLRNEQRYFGMMWGKFLNDPTFVDKYIDRESTDPTDPNAPPGYVPASWKDDPEFEAALNALCQKWGINTNHLLGLMAIETASKNINPAADNGTHAGLIQFSYGWIQNTAKMSVENFKKLTRAQQIPYVDKYFEMNKLPKNPTAAQLYTLVFLPAFIPYATDRNVVLASNTGYNSTPIGNEFSKQEIIGWWERNKTLRGSNPNDITVGDLEDRIKESTKNLGLPFAGGGQMPWQMPSVAPTTSFILGPKSGYPVSLDGGETTAFTGHGYELISGNKVYPIDTPAYNLFVDKEKTFTRWAEIYYRKSFDFQSALKMVTSTSEVKKPEVKVNYIPGSPASPSVSVSSSSSSAVYDEYFDPHLFREEYRLTRLR